MPGPTAPRSRVKAQYSGTLSESSKFGTILGHVQERQLDTASFSGRCIRPSLNAAQNSSYPFCRVIGVSTCWRFFMRRAGRPLLWINHPSPTSSTTKLSPLMRPTVRSIRRRARTRRAEGRRRGSGRDGSSRNWSGPARRHQDPTGRTSDRPASARPLRTDCGRTGCHSSSRRLHPQKQIGVDRRPAGMAVKGRHLPVEACQRKLHEYVDLAQRVRLGNPLIELVRIIKLILIAALASDHRQHPLANHQKRLPIPTYAGTRRATPHSAHTSPSRQQVSQQHPRFCYLREGVGCVKSGRHRAKACPQFVGVRRPSRLKAGDAPQEARASAPERNPAM